MNGFMTICPEDFPGERKIFFAGEKPLDKTIGVCYYNKALADVAHLVERHLAKVEVASSSLVIRSIEKTRSDDRVFLCSENHSLGEWFKKRLMSIMAK